MDIVNFANKYKKLKFPHNRTISKRVFVTDVSTSILVWDEGPFLVEQYLMHPNKIIVPHSHPFDNLVIFYSGSMIGYREGYSTSSWLTDDNYGDVGQVLPSGKWHSFETGKYGAVLYNISYWRDLSEKNSATIKYTGNPLGPLHAEELEKQRSEFD
jgi:hypothetical protein